MSEWKHYIKTYRDYDCKKNLPEAVCWTKCLRGEQRVGEIKINPEEHQNNQQLGESRRPAKVMVLKTLCGIFKNSLSTVFSIKGMEACSQAFRKETTMIFFLFCWMFVLRKKSPLIIANRMLWKGQIPDLEATDWRDFPHTHITSFLYSSCNHCTSKLQPLFFFSCEIKMLAASF